MRLKEQQHRAKRVRDVAAEQYDATIKAICRVSGRKGKQYPRQKLRQTYIA